jgi:hypothetical protein
MIHRPGLVVSVIANWSPRKGPQDPCHALLPWLLVHLSPVICWNQHMYVTVRPCDDAVSNSV